jgi:hypothetical protein
LTGWCGFLIQGSEGARKVVNKLRQYLYFMSPTQLLGVAYKDEGEALQGYLMASLREWLYRHADEEEDGTYTVRYSRGLLAGTESKRKSLDDVEPWEIADDPSIRDNLGLFLKLWTEGDEDIYEVLHLAEPSHVWAAAIVELPTRDWATMARAYDNLCSCLISDESHSKVQASKVFANLADRYQMLKDKFDKLGRKRTGNRALLQAKTDEARAKNRRATRESLALRFSNDTSVGLKKTQIKELYRLWYTEEDWPKSPGGRPLTRRKT